MRTSAAWCACQTHTRTEPPRCWQVLIGAADLKANHRITQIFDFPSEHEKYHKLVRVLEKVSGGGGGGGGGLWQGEWLGGWLPACLPACLPWLMVLLEPARRPCGLAVLHSSHLSSLVTSLCCCATFFCCPPLSSRPPVCRWFRWMSVPLPPTLGCPQCLTFQLHYMFLPQEMDGRRILIFLETKKGCDAVTRQLRTDGWPALSIHGDKSQQERDWVLAEFKAGKHPIMIATDVAARGLGNARAPRAAGPVALGPRRPPRCAGWLAGPAWIPVCGAACGCCGSACRVAQCGAPPPLPACLPLCLLLGRCQGALQQRCPAGRSARCIARAPRGLPCQALPWAAFGPEDGEGGHVPHERARQPRHAANVATWLRQAGARLRRGGLCSAGRVRLAQPPPFAVCRHVCLPGCWRQVEERGGNAVHRWHAVPLAGRRSPQLSLGGAVPQPPRSLRPNLTAAPQCLPCCLPACLAACSWARGELLVAARRPAHAYLLPRPLGPVAGALPPLASAAAGPLVATSAAWLAPSVCSGPPRLASCSVWHAPALFPLLSVLAAQRQSAAASATVVSARPPVASLTAPPVAYARAPLPARAPPAPCFSSHLQM